MIDLISSLVIDIAYFFLDLWMSGTESLKKKNRKDK